MKTEYYAESDRKAWVRYPPPRWIWQGAAICGIPSTVNAAMLHGWHGHNGVSLGNPRLGFVCTGQTVDGDPGLEGYYYDYGREIGEDVAWNTDGDGAVVRQSGWRLMRDIDLPPAGFQVWHRLWEGALAVHDRRLELVTERSEAGIDLHPVCEDLPIMP